jgi:Glycosyl transferase family 90
LEQSVPLLTTRTRVDCKSAFLVPSLDTIVDSKLDSNSWYKLFQNFDQEYPWSNKIRKVFWRGNMSEIDSDAIFDSISFRLVKLVNGNYDDFFDVGFFEAPAFASSKIDSSILGGIKTNLHATHQLQNYFAVLDIDDQVWTSRITALLCYNSVIIKVEPQYIDYFFNDLKPWKHYVPVKRDLSDLTENVRFVMDPKNDASIREIVASANQFCAERLVATQLALDLLHVWNHYVQNFDVADSNWEQKWSRKKAVILSSKLYGLVKLESRLA